MKVLNCNGIGTESQLVAGLDWILADHQSSQSVNKVVNMSIFSIVAERHPDIDPGCPNPYGDPFYETPGSSESKILALIENGVTVVTSANNQNMDARYTSPARLAYGNLNVWGPHHTITVGGSMAVTDSEGEMTGDTRWLSTDPVWNPCSGINTEAGSNWGPAIDLFAPAHNIWVANPRAIKGESTFDPLPRSGTSFAAPAVAGAIAKYLQGTTGKSPIDVWNQIKSDATHDAVANHDTECKPWETCNNDLLWSWGVRYCPRTRLVTR